LLEDLREADDEVEADVYEETSALTYTRAEQKVAIFEYQIVCDVQVSEESKPVAAKKRGAAAAEPFIKINRQQFNKVNRQMENTGKYPPELMTLALFCKDMKLRKNFAQFFYCGF
jgi:hypothetical protein